MEISLFFYLSIITHIFYFIGVFYRSDPDYQIIVSIVGTILFIALGLQAYNLEIIQLSNIDNTFQTNAWTEYIVVLYHWLMAVLSGLNLFVLIMERYRAVVKGASS